MMIKTERLLLQKPVKNDLEKYYEINSKPENNMFNPSGPMLSIGDASESFDKILEHWDAYNFGEWKIAASEDGIIGFGGLKYKKYGNEEKLNLGYRFDQLFWGKGYATELAQYAVQYGMNVLGKDEVYGLVRPDHKASIRVLEKCGMVKAGELDDVPGKERSLIYVCSRTI